MNNYAYLINSQVIIVYGMERGGGVGGGGVADREKKNG